MAFTCGGASYAAQRMYMLLYPRTGGVKGEKKLLKALAELEKDRSQA